MARNLERLLWVLALTTVVMQLQPVVAAQPVLRGAAHQQPPAQCHLDIQGAKRGGISRATLECSGGRQQVGSTVNLLVHEQLLGKFAASFKGVTWSKGSSKRPDCLLTIVGATHIAFVNSSSVGGVRGDLVPGLQHILCVAGSSRVEFLESFIFNNNATGLAVFDSAHVTLNASVLEGNTAVERTAGMLVTGGASARITQNGSVIDNVAILPEHLPNGTAEKPQAAGGVSVEGNASLLVEGGSIIQRNKVLSANDTMDVAGGILASGHARITITDSTIASNAVNSTSGGAGVLVVDSARLLITGGSSVTGNGPFTVNGAVGAVVARNDSIVHITGGAVFTANRAVASQLKPEEVAIAEGLQWGQFIAARDFVIWPDAALHLDESVRGDNGTLDACSTSVGWIRLPQINSCPVGAYPASALFCECCPALKYSFDVNISTHDCRDCPTHAVCPGNNRVVPEPGFWHSSPKSVQLHQCPNTAACAGAQCARGYEGTLCSSCAQGYGMTLPFRCVECKSPGRQLAFYALLAFSTFVFILCTVHFTLRDNRSGDTDVRPTDLIKIVVQYLQYMVILGSISAPWPNVVKGAFLACTVVFGAATGQALSVDCWLSLLRLSRPPLAVQRQLVNFLAPIVLACCVAAALALLCALSSIVLKRLRLGRRRVRPGSNNTLQRFPRMLPTVAIVVLFYAYPTLVKAALSFFACIGVDDPTKGPYPQYSTLTHPQGYWVYDMSQQCMVGWHKHWAFGLGLPAAILLCVGVPVGLVWLLLANRSRLNDDDFREMFGFLYRNNKQGRVWWEAVSAVQTMLLSTVAVFHFTIKAYYSIVLLSVMFVSSAVVQAIAKPYADRQLHRLHLAASGCLFLTAQCILTLFDVPGYAISAQAAPAVGVFIITVNAAFLLWCGVAILVSLAGPAGGAFKWLLGLVRSRVACGKAP